MLYNYSNPYTNSLMNMYGGGNNYQPISNVNSQNQQALNPFYQSVYPINNQRFSAFFVNDYSEVKNAIVSSDGGLSLFMMNDKDVFYIKKVGEDGRTILKSFDYTPEQIESFINQAYQQTSQIMAKYGKLLILLEIKLINGINILFII